MYQPGPFRLASAHHDFTRRDFLSRDFISRQIAYLDPENIGNSARHPAISIAWPEFAMFSVIALLLSALMLLAIVPMVLSGP